MSTTQPGGDGVLTPTQRAIRWSVIIGIGLIFCYYFRSILMPYIAGLALAYFLDPLADWFEKKGFKRIIAVTIITIGALLVIVLFVLLAAPLAFEQLVQLIKGFPAFAERVNAIIVERFPKFTDFEAVITQRITDSTDQIVGAITNWLVNSTSSVMSWVAAFIIVPTVAFYMLWDWDRVAKIVESWVPRDNLPTYRYLTGQVDRTLSGFVRGQGSVCLIMATYYSFVLVITGLNFGFIIGLIAGIMTAIPMIGGLVGGLLVIGVGFFQFVLGDNGNWLHYIIVLALYYGGQTVEGNFLTPKLVGNSVGLHPVWVLFALSAGAFIAGVFGMFVAVPVAAVIGVFAKYFMNQYKHGPLYLGKEYDKKTHDEKKVKRQTATSDG